MNPGSWRPPPAGATFMQPITHKFTRLNPCASLVLPQNIQDCPNECPPVTVVGTKVDLCDEGKREVSAESGEKLAAELGDSFDRPLRPETRLPKKAKARGEPPVFNPGPDIAYVETSAKLNKNIEGVSQSESSLLNSYLCRNLHRFSKTSFGGLRRRRGLRSSNVTKNPEGASVP